MSAASGASVLVACQRRDGFGPCEQMGTETVTVGCQHEHIRTVSVCARCLSITKRHPQWCVPCYEADGHGCDLMVASRDSGASS